LATSPTIELHLAHKAPGVKGIYNKAQRVTNQRWADYLDGLRTGSIVPFTARAA